MESTCTKILQRWTHLTLFKSFHLWLTSASSERALMVKYARCWGKKTRLTLNMVFDGWHHSSALRLYVQPRIKLILAKWDRNWLANMFQQWIEYLRMLREFDILALLNNAKKLDSPLHQGSPMKMKMSSLQRWHLACSRVARFREEELVKAKDLSLARAIGDQCLIGTFLVWKDCSCRQRLEGECQVQREKAEGLRRRGDKLRENLDRCLDSRSSMLYVSPPLAQHGCQPSLCLQSHSCLPCFDV